MFHDIISTDRLTCLHCITRDPITVEIRNSACSEIGVSRFLFFKNGNPLGFKRLVPEKKIRKNQRGRFSFKLDGKPDRLVLSGSTSGDEFTYRIGLNWGENVRETSCGRITVTVPYKGGVKYPVARFSWHPGEPKTGGEVTLNAGNSVGDIQYYGWNFDGDGEVDQWTRSQLHVTAGTNRASTKSLLK